MAFWDTGPDARKNEQGDVERDERQKIWWFKSEDVSAVSGTCRAVGSAYLRGQQCPAQGEPAVHGGEPAGSGL